MKHNSGTRTPSLLVIFIYVSDLERVQKSACKLILKEKYISYVDELRKLNIQSLYERRQLLLLKLAKKGLFNFESCFLTKKQIHRLKT